MQFGIYDLGCSLLVVICICQKENIVVIIKPEFEIGRNPDVMDYCITDNNDVCRTHAEIMSQDGIYYLVDLDSKNGTFINSNKIESGFPSPI
jgi:pSer/pThr/pTyr-binding forkhead associated (FHA) protein